MQDSAGNALVESFLTGNASIYTPAILIAAGSIDSNQNGYIDGYRVMFNMPMADACIVGEFATIWFLTHWIPVPDPILRTSVTTCNGPIERTNTDQFWCVEAEENTQGGYNTDLTGTWTSEGPNNAFEATGWVSGGGAIPGDVNRFGYLLDGGGNISDWAGPVLIQVDTYDSTSSGYIDTVVLTFTEPVKKNTTTAGDWTSQSTPSVTIPASPIVSQTASQLVFSLASAGQTLNTAVPAIEYIRYKPNFTDLNDNPIERRTPLLFEVAVIQSARGRVGSVTVTLHFTYSAPVMVSGLSFDGGNAFTIPASRDMVTTLLAPLTQMQMDSALFSAGGVSVPVTALTTTVYVNQNIEETDVLPASALLPTAAVSAGCEWQGDINALFIAGGLSATDFDATFRFFQARVNTR
jgi:hypothetical protein